MQKFTRPLTREIELGGERLALTFSEKGIVLRPVGSRRPPWEMSWGALAWHVTGSGAGASHEPTAEQVSTATERIKSGGPSKPAGSEPAPAPAPEPAPSAERNVPAPRPNHGGDGSGRGRGETEIAGLLRRLERWLANERPRYQAALLPDASPESLDFLENALGTNIPAELGALLSWHNGQSDDFVGHLEGDWDLMSATQIVAAKRELDDAGQGGWQRSWIPFLKDDNDDYVVLDTSVAGTPVREFWQGNPDHSIVARSLTAWLEDFVLALERGEYVEDSERGTMLRRRENANG